MVNFKSQEEIAIMAEAGKKLRQVIKVLLPEIKPGITTSDIDNRAEELIHQNGGQSSFKRVNNYRWSTCLPINEQIVHTPPSKRIIKKGDVLTVDIGLFYRGYHSDYATTFVVGAEPDNKIKKFLEVGKVTLKKAIEKVRTGQRLGEVSKLIENEVEGNGYFIVRELTGHGIGHQLHEDPYVPGFLNQPIDKTLMIKPGLVVAIEIIYSMGSRELKYEDDWSIITGDRSLSACFEDTVAVSDKNTLVLT